MRKLMGGSILVLVYAVLGTPVLGEIEVINTLMVTKGPGVGEITLNWGGDFSPYAVYRSGVAPGVVAPANLQTYTASNNYTDPTPIGDLLFFNVNGACTSSTDTPDLAFADSNCDGIDGNPLEAIFVDTVTGNDGNTGAINAPKQTIGSGIGTASAAMPKKSVYVSKGSYPESPNLVSGVSIYGGYDAAAGWTRSNANTTTIASPTTYGLFGANLTGPIEVQLFTITSQNATGTIAGSGNSSYGVFIRLSSSVALQGLTIMPGSASSATPGNGGAPGPNGGTGGNASGPNRGGTGASSCGATGGFGGQGVSGPNFGQPGVTGTQVPGGGSGGGGGIQGNPGSSCGGGTTNGGPGTPGASNGGNGNPGTNGTGSAGLGTFFTAYAPPIGNNGGTGAAGGGGGGGASGGGAEVPTGSPFCFGCSALTSGGGGGGGGGGCGGGGGQGGRGGGGSFGVVSVASTVTITSCQITTKNGGGGSSGGNGGPGGGFGNGGSGAAGGTNSSSCGTRSAGAGGIGTRGGSGGSGGGGSGGAGGPTVCVAYNGALPSQSGNACTLGIPGFGGSGGTGNGTAPSGPNGAVANTLNFP